MKSNDNRRPLNISIQEDWAERHRKPILRILAVIMAISFFAVGFAVGMAKGESANKPLNSKAKPLPLITVEEFTEMADKCQN